MSNALYDTQESQQWQENDEQWNQMIASVFPEGWREQARALGAWQRTRKVKDPADLLRALLVYASAGYSFRLLGLWATLKGIGSLSERAWRKRLERSAAWISWLLGAMLLTQEPATWFPQGAGRLLLVDATALAMPAGHGDDLKLHCGYDLLQGRLEQVVVTDRHQAERVAHLDVRHQDVIVTDAGYVARQSVAATRNVGAFLLQRFSAHHVRLEEEAGQAVALKERIEHQGYGQMSEQEYWLTLPEGKERVPVRVVAFRLPFEQAKMAQERKAKRLRQQYGRQYSREAVWWAQWCLLLSTLPQSSWSADALLQLYRMRWQIEMFFKRLKQCLHLHGVCIQDLKRAQVLVHLHLIVWALQERVAEGLRQSWWSAATTLEEAESWWWQEEAEEDQTVLTLSRTTVAQICLQHMLQILRGSWSLGRLKEMWPQLQRYLGSKRRRRLQETTARRWVLKHLSAATPP